MIEKFFVKYFYNGILDFYKKGSNESLLVAYRVRLSVRGTQYIIEPNLVWNFLEFVQYITTNYFTNSRGDR